MRILLAITIAVWAASCTGAPPPAVENETPEVLVIQIPRAPAQPDSSPGDDGTFDLDAIAERGVIRVLVARSGTHFFAHDGGHAGKSVDIGVALAQSLSEQVRKTVRPVFVETHEADLIPDLLAGKGDVAANLLLTFDRDDKVAFAPPIRTGIRELVVTAKGAPLVSLEDVGTRTIYVRQDSDHHASLLRLNEQLKSINRPAARIVLALPPITDEQLLERVNDGHAPATLADDYIFERQAPKLPNITANRDVAVSQDGSLAWVTRKDASGLIAFVKQFFSTHRLTF